MARTESRYVCGTCGDAFLRWEGQCRTCGAWNSLVETVVREPKRAERARIARASGAVATAQPLAGVGGSEAPRLPVGIGELDRVLGGGLVPGSVVLLGGEPGIGKSTLLLQMVAALVSGPGAERGALYATGEESAAQVHLRAGRLGLLAGPAGERVRILAEHEVGRIVEEARANPPEVVVVDSIQTATVDDLEGAAGSVGQVREATLRLMEFAKGEGTAVILAGHVTKDGSIAGPKTLEHLVDAVVNLEGERFAALRLLRASKNRFGSTEEVGVFEMRDAGLSEVTDPGRAFLGEHDEPAPGSVIAPTMEGSRPSWSRSRRSSRRPVRGARPTSQRPRPQPAESPGRGPRSAGRHRAVRPRRLRQPGRRPVGDGARPGPAIALALASSLRDRPLIGGTVAIGEVGLLGELRPVAGLERRLREAARLGFGRAIVPAGAKGDRPLSVSGMDVIVVASLADAVRGALAAGPVARGEAVAAMLG